MRHKAWKTALTLLLALLSAERASATPAGSFFFDPETGDRLPNNRIRVMFQDNPAVSPGTYILSIASFSRRYVGGEELFLLNLGENFFLATAPFIPSISITPNTAIVGLLDGDEIVQSVNRGNFVASVVDNSFVISSIDSRFPSKTVPILFEVNPTFLQVQALGGILPGQDFGVGFQGIIPEPSAAGNRGHQSDS